MPAFTSQEYRARTAALKDRMVASGMDAIMVLNESNMHYLTGYDGYSDYVPQLALVCLDDEDAWLVLREMDVLCATGTSYLPDSRILAYPEKYIGSDHINPWQPIAQLIRERCKSGRLGIEFTARPYGVKAHAALGKHLDLSACVDGDGMVAKLKLIKSPAEIAYMEQAGKIVDRAMQIGCEAIREGVRECDVAAAVTGAVVAGTPEFPGGASRILAPTMPVGSPATAPHIKWSDGKYVMGTQTNFEVGAFRHRYCCALSRTVFLGEPPARSRYVHDAVTDGWLAAFESIRPGATCGDVDRAFRDAFDVRGVRKESRIGYSIGIDWSDGGASIQKGDNTVLKPNMTFHIIVGIWEKEDGYVFSETVRVTGDGANSLSSMTREMIVKA